MQDANASIGIASFFFGNEGRSKTLAWEALSDDMKTSKVTFQIIELFDYF